MKITSQIELEEVAVHYGILPFFPNNIPGFSVEEMAPPSLLFGGNEYEGCWEWKGPVVRTRSTVYGKFFRRKAGFVSKELLPLFLKFRRSLYRVPPASTEEMIYDIISINGSMSSTDLRGSLSGESRRRTAFDLPDLSFNPHVAAPELPRRPSRHSVEGPLQRLQMGGWVCISDFRYKLTRRGERYGWGVAEYSTPEMLFDRDCLFTPLSPEDSLESMVDYVVKRFPSATSDKVRKLLSF